MQAVLVIRVTVLPRRIAKRSFVANVEEIKPFDDCQKALFLFVGKC